MEYFLDIELNKKQFLLDCYGGFESNNTIVGFHLLDGGPDGPNPILPSKLCVINFFCNKGCG